MPSAANGTGSIKRRRRTREQMDAIRGAITLVLEEDHPQTVRQVFYRLTAAGVVAKTEAEYKRTVCRLLAEMRRDGTVPYGWLADSTRWMRRPETFSSLEEALRRTAATYRRSLWDDASEQVEIWLEKEALAGVLVTVTEPWDVPLMVAKGYPSISFTHSAAEAIAARYERSAQRTCIYYFGDRDPSGLDIDRTIVRNIGESLLSGFGLTCQYTPEVMFNDIASFERVAVTEEQVAGLGLPSRPTKKTDTRSKGFKGESVEVDAIPARDLRRIAEEAIEGHVDHHRLGVLRHVEEEERAGLERIAGIGQ
jgi:hypothetical protein